MTLTLLSDLRTGDRVKVIKTEPLNSSSMGNPAALVTLVNEHGNTFQRRTQRDGAVGYAIDNSEYRERWHVVELSRGGAIVSLRDAETLPAPSRPVTKAETQRRDREEARDRLRRIFPEGSRVAVVLTHVAPSGMSRRFLVLATVDGEIRDVSRLVVRAGVGQSPRGDKAGVTMTGTGMDMAFALVYELTHALHGAEAEMLRHDTIFGA